MAATVGECYAWGMVDVVNDMEGRARQLAGRETYVDDGDFSHLWIQYIVK